MRVYGLDFTSAPRWRKPITQAVCTLDGDVLRLDESRALYSFGELEACLDEPGPWIAGLDFPFGQPRTLIQNLGWPEESWADYVRMVGGLTLADFERRLKEYRAPRLKGDKHHLRATDKLAGALSSMMLFGVPVGRMFFRGAPRPLRATCRVVPFDRPSAEHDVVVEAYPALVARKLIGKRSYKSDGDLRSLSAASEAKLVREQARRDLVDEIRSGALRERYGFDLHLGDEQAASLVADPTGDHLDALLCAVQAGWAYGQRERGYGMPADCDPLEGWIADPELAGAVASR